jgi:hypothetical protein
MEVLVNGRKIDYLGTPIEIPLDELTTIAIRKPGFTSFVTRMTLTKEMDSRVINVPDLEPSRMGLLTTSQNYAAGSKLVYEEGGEMVERVLPFKDVEVPEGSYQAKVVNPILGTEKRVQFSIEEHKKHFLE